MASIQEIRCSCSIRLSVDILSCSCLTFCLSKGVELFEPNYDSDVSIQHLDKSSIDSNDPANGNDNNMHLNDPMDDIDIQLNDSIDDIDIQLNDPTDDDDNEYDL